MKKEQLEDLLTGSLGQNLALTVLYVPSLLDNVIFKDCTLGGYSREHRAYHALYVTKVRF